MNGDREQTQPVRFAIFDWLDESGRGYAETYDERLRLLERADALGFYGYHLAEHHGTSLSTTPSPVVFLSAVAQRTARLRLGALTWVLPLYNPLRLLEELCMLDHLSHGRLDIGVGRGSSPHERQHFGVTPEESRPRFEEELELLVMGFRTGAFDYHGEYYNYDALKTRFRPYQKPYPPLWYPTSNAESISYMAAQGFHMAISARHWPSFPQVCEALAQYRREYALHQGDPNRLNGHVSSPHLGLSIHIHVAETDEKARDQARPAYAAFHENFTRRYFELGMDKYPRQEDFDKLVDDEKVLCGSPETVHEVLGRIVNQSGANYIMGAFMFGNLSPEHERNSLELFAREVMPAFAQSRAAV